jgi:hypothetical protein
MLRNGGPASTGTLARHAPEPVAGMDRNPQVTGNRVDVDWWIRRIAIALARSGRGAVAQTRRDELIEHDV